LSVNKKIFTNKKNVHEKPKPTICLDASDHYPIIRLCRKAEFVNQSGKAGRMETFI
jgi:hypothetical protein